MSLIDFNCIAQTQYEISVEKSGNINMFVENLANKLFKLSIAKDLRGCEEPLCVSYDANAKK